MPTTRAKGGLKRRDTPPPNDGNDQSDKAGASTKDVKRNLKRGRESTVEPDKDPSPEVSGAEADEEITELHSRLAKKSRRSPDAPVKENHDEEPIAPIADKKVESRGRKGQPGRGRRPRSPAQRATASSLPAEPADPSTPPLDLSPKAESESRSRSPADGGMTTPPVEPDPAASPDAEPAAEGPTMKQIREKVEDLVLPTSQENSSTPADVAKLIARDDSITPPLEEDDAPPLPERPETERLVQIRKKVEGLTLPIDKVSPEDHDMPIDAAGPAADVEGDAEERKEPEDVAMSGSATVPAEAPVTEASNAAAPAAFEAEASGLPVSEDPTSVRPSPVDTIDLTTEAVVEHAPGDVDTEMKDADRPKKRLPTSLNKDSKAQRKSPRTSPSGSPHTSPRVSPVASPTTTRARNNSIDAATGPLEGGLDGSRKRKFPIDQVDDEGVGEGGVSGSKRVKDDDAAARLDKETLPPPPTPPTESIVPSTTESVGSVLSTGTTESVVPVPIESVSTPITTVEKETKAAAPPYTAATVAPEAIAPEAPPVKKPFVNGFLGYGAMGNAFARVLPDPKESLAAQPLQTGRAKSPQTFPSFSGINPLMNVSSPPGESLTDQPKLPLPGVKRTFDFGAFGGGGFNEGRPRSSAGTQAAFGASESVFGSGGVFERSTTSVFGPAESVFGPGTSPPKDSPFSYVPPSEEPLGRRRGGTPQESHKKVDRKPVGEEDEVTKESCRVKLYDNSSGSWKERGVGILKLNVRPTDERARLIMRTDAVYKLLMNNYLFRTLSLDVENQGKFLRLTFVEGGDMVSYLLKFGSVEAGQKMIDRMKEYIPKQPPSTHTLDPAKEGGQKPLEKALGDELGTAKEAADASTFRDDGAKDKFLVEAPTAIETAGSAKDEADKGAASAGDGSDAADKKADQDEDNDNEADETERLVSEVREGVDVDEDEPEEPASFGLGDHEAASEGTPEHSDGEKETAGGSEAHKMKEVVVTTAGETSEKAEGKEEKEGPKETATSATTDEEAPADAEAPTTAKTEVPATADKAGKEDTEDKVEASAADEKAPTSSASSPSGKDGDGKAKASDEGMAEEAA